MPNPAPFERAVGAARRAAQPLRPRRPDARLRRAADGAEVARRDASPPSPTARASRSSSPATGSERDALVADVAAAGSTDRVRLLGALPRERGARALRRRRREHPLVELGELPAQRRRVARRRHAGDRDAGPAASRRWSRTASTGCSFPSGDADALAAAMRRYFADEGLRDAAARACRGDSVAAYRPDRLLGDARADARGGGAMKPRVLFVARTRYALPLDRDACSAASTRSPTVMEWRQLGDRPPTAAMSSDDRFTLVRPLPARIARRGGVLRRAPAPGRPRDPVVPARTPSIVQGTQDTSLALAGRAVCARSTCRSSSTSTATGATTRASTARRPRRLLSPAVDRLADYAVRHADGVRTVSGFTTEPRARPRRRADGDLSGLHGSRAVPRHRPGCRFPAAPRALFVGVLERYKAVDVLAEAWRTRRAAGAGGEPADRRARAARGARRGARRPSRSCT